jgi:hypothetical protein
VDGKSVADKHPRLYILCQDQIATATYLESEPDGLLKSIIYGKKKNSYKNFLYFFFDKKIIYT